MALGIVVVEHGMFGHHTRRNLLTITPDSSWADGGEAITPNEVGLSTISALNIYPNNGIQPKYDSGLGKVTLGEGAGVNIQQTRLEKDDFTDVTTTGTADTDDLPEGSLVLGWQFVCDNAFSGDTSATGQLGVSGDLNRFSADTSGSIFTTGTIGSAPLAADVMDSQSAAITPRFTVTVNSDFTSVDSEASGDLFIFYLNGGAAIPTSDLSGTTFFAEAIGV